MSMSFHQYDEAGRHQEGADRADERPRARIDEVVVVVLGVGLGHFVSSPCLECCARFRTFPSELVTPLIARWVWWMMSRASATGLPPLEGK